MVYGFTKQSGGQTVIESEEGKGTTVRLYFPVAGGVAEAKEAVAEKRHHRLSESKGVLVVEDDEDVRDSLVMMLSDLGYETHQAEDGPAALAVLEKVSNIDLLFTDVILPGGMNGKELAHEVKRNNGGIKVLLTSGYPRQELADDGKLDEMFDLLPKPYTLNELANRMRTVLEADVG